MRKLLIFLFFISTQLVFAVVPGVISAVWEDSNGDGTIDQLLIAFDRDIDIVDVGGAADGLDCLVFSGGTVTITQTGVDYTTSAAGVTTLTLEITPVSSTSIAGFPTLDYTNANSDHITEHVTPFDEVANGTIPTTDGASPIVLQTLTIDSDEDGIVEAMEVQFSETVSDATLTANFADWTLDDGGGATSFTGYSTNVSVIASDTDGDDDYGTLTINTGISGTQVMNYAYSNGGADITDTSVGANALGDITSVAAADGAAPVVIDLEIRDDGDGFVDEIQVTWSENVDTDDSLIPVSGDFGTITLPDGNTATLSGFTDPAGSSNIVTLTGITGHTANENTAAGSTAIASIPAGAWTDGLNTNTAQAGDAEAVTDAASPILISSVPSDEDTDVSISANQTLTFSESVVAGTGNIYLIDTNDGSGDDTYDVTSAPELSGFSTSTITINPGSDLENFETYAIQLDGTAVDDASAGANSYAGIGDNTTLNFTTIGAIPTFTATWLDNSGNGDIDQLRLDFSEAVSFSDGNGTTGIFDGITVTGGIALTNPGSVDYSTVTGVTTYTFDVSGVTGTADPGETISYAAGAQNDITADAGGQQLAGSPTAVNDGASPIVLQTLTIDSDEDGIVEAMEVQFSEAVSDATLTANFADWTLDDGGGSTSFTGYSTNVSVIASDTDGDDDYGTLTINTGISGTQVMNYAYSNGGADITDTSVGANALGDITSVAAADGAAPVVIDLEIRDDGDGFVDEIQVTWSENVDTDDSSIPVSGDFGTITLPDGNTATLSGFTDPAGSSNIVTLTGITGHTANENTAAGSTAIASIPAGAWTDGLNTNTAQAGDAEAVTDAASPILISSVPSDEDTDVSISANQTLTFSESVVAGTGNIYLIDTNDGSGDDTYDVTSAPELSGFSTSTITINPGSDLENFETYAIQLDGTAVDDASAGANSYAGIGDNTTLNFTTIGAIPTFTATWLDNSGNGDIDQLRLDFSEAVSFSDGNGTTGIFDGITVTGGIALTNPGSVDYSTVTGVTTYTFDVSGVTGTADPGETISYAAGAQNDITADAGGQQLAGSPTAVNDGASPIVLQTLTIDSDEDGIVEAMEVQFSEAVSDATLTANFADWTLDDGGGSTSFTGYSTNVSVIASDTDGDDDYGTLTINTGISGTQVMNYAYSNGGADITDTSVGANALGDITSVAAADGAAPVVIDLEIRDDGDGFVDEIQVTWSENVDTDDSSIPVSGDFGTITLPDGNTATLSGFTDPAGSSNIVTLTGITGHTANENTAAGSTAIASIPAGAWTDGLNTNTAQAGDAEAVTDAASPILISSVPSDEDTDVSISANQTLTFSESVVAGTGNIYLIDTNDGSGDDTYDVTSAPELSGFSTSTITINPGSDLENFETYAIQLDGTAVDDASAGANSYAGIGDNTTLNFTTIGAIPTFTATWLDNSGNGDIDQLRLDFSEAVSFSDGNGTTGIFDGITVTGGIALTNPGSVDYSTVTGVTTYTFDVSGVTGTADPGETISYAAGAQNDITADAGGQQLAGSPTAVGEEALPVILSQTLDANNAYLELTFSEGLYTTGGGALTSGVGEFALAFNQNAGTATNVTVLVYSQTDNTTATAAGDNVIRFQLETTGIADGNETIQITANATSVYDNASPRNAMAGGETLGSINLNAVNAADIPVFVSALPSADNAFVYVEFSIPVDDNSSTGTDGNLEIRTTGGDDFNPELRTGNFMQNGGGATNATANDQSMTNDAGGAQTTGTIWRYTTNLSGGTPTGDETFDIFPKNGAEVWGSSTGLAQPASDVITVTMADEVAEDFTAGGGTTAFAYDVDGDGNIDEVAVVMPDDIDDATITPSDFTFNGITAASFVSSPSVINVTDDGTANDNVFTLGFTTYTGTAVVGTLDYTAGTLQDDAYFGIYNGVSGDGNAVGSGSITPTDAAGPIISSAITADNDLNGQLDEITVTFSEAFSDIDIDVSDFSLSDSYTISGVAVSSPDITLSLNEKVVNDTYITPDVTIVPAGAGMLEDLSAGTAPNPTQTFTNTGDGAAPYFTINTSSPTITTDPTPDLSGTIDDPNATVLISIGANSALSATNDGVGNWTLAGSALTTPLGLQTYSVSYTTFDLASPINIRTATVPNVIEVQGGVLVEDATGSFEALTGAEAVTVCIGAQQALSTIRIAETNPTDFSATGTYILNLPAGFEFDTGASLSIINTTGGGNISIGTIEYIGTSSLSIQLVDDGNADEVDVITVDGLIIEGTGSIARTNSVITVTGDVGILTNQTSFGELSSLVSPTALTDLEDTSDPGTPITEFITQYLPRVRVDYTLTVPLQTFTPGEVVNFSGGASGIIVTDNGLNQMQVNLTSGTVANAETITEVSSGRTATTTADAVGLTRDLLPFSLEASPTATSNWYFDGVVDLTPDLTASINNNTALGATTPGLYTYAITDDDGCESQPLIFNVLVYNDVHPDNDSRTFVDQVLTVNGSVDTLYLSNPTNHTVSVTGNGISVAGGGADPLIAYFDPAIAGDNGGVGETHTITYSVTNDITGETLSVQADFEVLPETEFFNPPLDPEYCITEFPLAGNLTVEEATFYTSNTSNFFQILFDNFISANVQGIDKRLDNSYMYFYNNALFSFQTTYGGGVTYEFPFDPQTWSGLAFAGNGFGDDLIMGPGEGSIFYVERNRFDNATSQSTIEFDFLEVYGRPYVQLSGLNEQYCDSDTDLVTINRSVRYVNDFESTDPDNQYATWNPVYVTLEEEITNGYYLYRSNNGVSYTLLADFSEATGSDINVFNPNDPDQDGQTFADDGDTDDIGYFRIIYDTEALGPESCVGTTSIDVFVNPRPAMLELNAATLAAGSSINFVNTDEYQLEYCVGATPAGFTAENFEDGQLIYSSTRTATLTHPNSPTYTIGETVKGATSGATAEVITDDGTTMTIGDINGEFEVGEIIKGQTTSFNSAIATFNETTTNFIVGETITSGTGSATILSDKGNVLGLDNLVGTISGGQSITGSTSGTIKTVTLFNVPTDITWYDQNQNPLPAAVNFNPTVAIGAVGLSVTGADQAEFYFSTTGTSGCESDLRKVTVNIFDIPEAPVLDASGFPAAAQSGNIYTFDYCVEDGGASTTPDALILDDLLDDDRYNVTREFRDFSASSVIIDNTTITEIDGNTDTNDESIAVPDIFAGDSIIFTITKTENISIAPDNVFSNFPGCTSTEAITIRIVAHEEATNPTQLDFVAGTTEFHICEGEALGNISHTFITGTDEYTWYEDIDGGNNGVARIGDVLGVGDPMTEATLGTASINPFDANTPGVYTYYVSRNNDVVDSRDFDGCESEAVPVSITVHGIQDAPKIFSDNSANASVPSDFPNLDPDDDDFFEFAVCSDQLFADLTFITPDSVLYAGDERVEWYNASTGNLLYTGEQPTFADLFLVGLGAQVVTFEVIQVTDTLTDSFGNVFDGCNSNTATVEITIADPAELTVVDALDAELNSSYCRDEDPEGDGDVDVFIRVGSTLTTDPTDVGYEINSYLKSTYDAGDPAEIDGSLINGSFPVLDLVALHDALPGTMDIGGEATVHEVIMYYTDPASFCTGSVTKVITINPDPHISFEVSGVDINEVNFTSGFNNFCYEQGNVSLRGVQYVYDNTGIIDTINLTTGQFSSDQTGTLGGNIGEGNFNPTVEHNAAYGETGQGAKYLNRTANGSLITFNYTDGNGCQISVSENLFIEPEPEIFDVERVTSLDPSDLAAGRATNIIRIQDFCNDGTDAQATVVLVDPIGGENDVLGDYTNYSFEWTINGDPVPDDGMGNSVPQVGVNTLTFTPVSTNVNIRVVVTDPNLCSETFTEVHQLQTLPDLDFPEIFDFEEFCADDANVSLTLDDYVGGQAAANVGDVVSWEVLSYNTNRTDTANNAVQSGWSTATVAQDLVGGTFPTIDLQTWHEAAGGVTYVDGRSVGGNATVHTIYITYQDATREYQGVSTSCEATYFETIIINPNPDITVLVDGNDINGFQVGQDQFCYDENTIELAGVFATDSSSLFTSNGQFVLVIGQDDDFSSENDDLNIPTSNNTAFVNAFDLHDEYWNIINGTTDIDYPYETQSSSVIQFEYQDENGCFNFVETTLFVDPVPEEIRVDTGSPQDGQVFFVTGICNDDSGEIIAEVRFIDPADPAGTAEEDDYSAYTFSWSLDGQSISTTLSNGELNTNVISVSDRDFVVEVEVTDLNGCSVSFDEFHQKQDLPFLDLDEIFDFQEFCSDEPVPTLTLIDYIGGGSVVDASDVVLWQIVSYQTNRIDTVENPVSAAWATDTVSQGGGSVPQIDLETWHVGAGGTAYAGTKSIGGNSTVHSIYVTYIDPTRTYQGLNTLCESTYVETILINPNPDISFTLDDLDQDNIELCYDDAGITLVGIDAVSSAPLGGGVFDIPGVAISTNNGEAVFSAADAHGTDPYAQRSTHTIEYTYQDDNLCEHTVSKTFLVNPRPEFVGTPDNNDIDGIQVANSCASSDIKVFVEMVDNKDLYIFEWTVNGGDPEQILSGSVGGDTLVYALGEG